MPYLDTPRLRFHYRTHGDPDGIPMLLLHGSFASSRWWEPFCAILPDEVYAVAPDLRGSGETEKPADGYAIGNLAADVDAFVRTAGLRNFDLVGHASGGAVALDYVLDFAPPVTTLSLIAPPPIDGIVTPLEGIILLERMRTDRALLSRALGALLTTYAEPSTPTDPAAAFFEQLVDDAARQAPAAFTDIAASLSQWNRIADAARLSLPALLIWGDQDPIVDQAAMTRTMLAIPGVNNLEVLRGVGHSPMVEAPLRLAERLMHFLTESTG